jgi:C4-dicarboxylate transporter
MFQEFPKWIYPIDGLNGVLVQSAEQEAAVLAAAAKPITEVTVVAQDGTAQVVPVTGTTVEVSPPKNKGGRPRKVS